MSPRLDPANPPPPAYVLGVDPGGDDTGLCLRQASTGAATDARVIHREPLYTRAGYLDRIIRAIAELADPVHGRLVVAVEDVTEPNAHLGIIGVRGLLGTAIVLGAVLAEYPGAVVVPPHKHGSKPLAAYPPLLRGPRETRLNRVGTGRLRHARSAYDVAGVAGMYATPPYHVLPTPAPGRG